MNYSLEIMKVIFYLLLVLGMIYLLAKLFRQKLGIRGGQRIKVLERVYLNQKSSLQLIQVAQKVFLISVTDQRVNILEKWENPDFLTDFPLEKEKSFKDYLGDLVNTRRDRDE